MKAAHFEPVQGIITSVCESGLIRSKGYSIMLDGANFIPEQVLSILQIPTSNFETRKQVRTHFQSAFTLLGVVCIEVQKDNRSNMFFVARCGFVSQELRDRADMIVKEQNYRTHKHLAKLTADFLWKNPGISVVVRKYS